MKKWRKLEKASREIAKKIKKKKKKRKQEKKNFIEAKQLAAQLHVWVACPSLIKFSKPQTNHSKNLIKCVKKIVYYFYKNKVVCLQFYNHFFISSFSHNSFLCFTFLLLFLHLVSLFLTSIWLQHPPDLQLLLLLQLQHGYTCMIIFIPF